jgi:hemoglobin
MKALKLASLPALVLLAGFIAAFSTGQVGAQEPATASLFERLGGYSAIAAVTDDFLGRLGSDPQVGRFFVGHGEDSKKRARQLTVDFICNATGGPCFYNGRTMEVTHEGMGITAADWEISMGHLEATLDRFAVPSPEREEVVAFISGLRDSIVDDPVNDSTEDTVSEGTATIR